MEHTYFIYGINGPVITVRGGDGLAVMDTVYVGNDRLLGEVVGVAEREAVVQVYEDTIGLAPGEPVETTGNPMSIALGPGLLNNMFDGIARPLRALEQATGYFIGRGASAPTLDAARKWDVTFRVKEGDTLSPGQIFCECPETPVIAHRSMVPPGVSGRVRSVKPNGAYTVDDDLVTVETKGGTVSLKLAQLWPTRQARPAEKRLPISKPLITGQRVIDSLFPVAKGGCAAIPGPFGAGKTVTQHQLAKWSDADIIVYLGCGERGNEMTEVLEEFSELEDPRTGNPLLARTVLIANTSNMPVAAREASIYTGMTIAEYYRDMGYHVAIMADSTSRWAEALREISGRLEEMPAEEGFPAYLPSRLAEFYERAGYMRALSGEEGSVTVIGAVSPQGGDFSEPVTQNTKRFIRCFWALDRSLAYARHFPAINWVTSYSEYAGELARYYEEQVSRDFLSVRARISGLLLEESKLMEIVKLIGADILPEDQQLIIEIARVIRVGFLQQNSFHPVDTYVPIEKQLAMMELILHLYDGAKQVVDADIPLSQLRKTGVFEDVVRVKTEVKNDELAKLSSYRDKIDRAVRDVLAKNGGIPT